ncbi:hypothetical protein ACI3PL_20290, partial [Lacticaseibacillus paracasei]
MVPLVGYVGADNTTSMFSTDGLALDEVEGPEDATRTTVAVEIRGTSLGPVFDRWLVFYDDRRDPPDDSLFGRLCVVGLED